ncbi:sigma factor [Bradyrhizobium sp.]|uniref:RNA polymerase sigma factor n=1 Tax=Bradyrhizobium sp. TaxID=376 RepID=UPI0025C54E0C|nr:sigma factor [Bradyrhizobium sp.]
MSSNHQRAEPARETNHPTDTFMGDLLAARPALRRYALHLCGGNHDDADDLLQDTMHHAIKGQQGFERGSCMIAWLKVIAKRTRWATVKRDLVKVDNDRDGKPIFKSRIEFTDRPNYADHIEADCKPDDRKIERAVFAAITKKLNPLIAAMLRRSINGETMEALAERFGLPLNTVKSHLRRGRAQLVAVSGGI